MNVNKEYLENLGKQLRKFRIEKKMSMQFLADTSNVDKSTIYRIEKGLINPTIIMLKNLCETLEIKIGSLIEE